MNDTDAPPINLHPGLECRWCGQVFKTRRSYRHHRARVRKYGGAHEDRRDEETRKFDASEKQLNDYLKLLYSPKRLVDLVYADRPLMRLLS